MAILANSFPASRPQQSTPQMQHSVQAWPCDIQYLPPGFGRRLKLDEIDQKLLRFCNDLLTLERTYTDYIIDLVAYCEGRTLLAKTNFWISSIASMAVEEECVMHALLALAGTYLLDYLRSPLLLTRTNNHYKQAVSLITEALSTTEIRTSNRGDSIVSALSLLIVDDVSRPLGLPTLRHMLTKDCHSVSTGSYGAKIMRCLIGF